MWFRIVFLAPASILMERPVDRLLEGGRATVLMPSSMSETKAFYSCEVIANQPDSDLHKQVFNNMRQSFVNLITDEAIIPFKPTQCLGGGAYGLAYKGQVNGEPKVMKVFVRNDKDHRGAWNSLKHRLGNVPLCSRPADNFLIRDFQGGTTSFDLPAEIWDEAPGMNLAQLAISLKSESWAEVEKVAKQVFCKLRMAIKKLQASSTKHGDVDVANIMFDKSTQKLTLIDYDLMGPDDPPRSTDGNVDDEIYGPVGSVLPSFFTYLCRTLQDDGWKDDNLGDNNMQYDIKCAQDDDRNYEKQAGVFASTIECNSC